MKEKVMDSDYNLGVVTFLGDTWEGDSSFRRAGISTFQSKAGSGFTLASSEGKGKKEWLGGGRTRNLQAGD